MSGKLPSLLEVFVKIKESWKDKIHGGLADPKKPSDFDPNKLKAGMKVEMEHTDDPKIAAEIVMDHLSEDPDYYEKLQTIEGKTMSTPKLTELFNINEANWNEPELDLGKDKHGGDATKSRKPPMSMGDRLKSKGQASRLAARQKRAGDKSVAAGNLKSPQQGILPGMKDVFKKWDTGPQTKAQFNKQTDDRLPLDQVKGKFMHVSQGSPEAVSLMHAGHSYETIPKRAIGKIDTNPGAQWGSGTFKIEDDGTFTPGQSDWDSSG